MPPPLNDAVWLNGWDGENVLWWDECNFDMKYHTFLQVLDANGRIPLPVKGDMIYPRWDIIIITCMKNPQTEVYKNAIPIVTGKQV